MSERYITYVLVVFTPRCCTGNNFQSLVPQGERTNSRPGIELCNYEYGGTKNDVQSRECQFHVILGDWEANDDKKCPLPEGYKVERKYALYEQCVDLSGPLENDKASSANVQGKSGLGSIPQ